MKESVNNLSIESDLSHLVRLALDESFDDVRMFVARLVRRYRKSNPELAGALELHLEKKPVRSSLRRKSSSSPRVVELPSDEDSGATLLRTYVDQVNEVAPLHSDGVRSALQQLLLERESIAVLNAAGLRPSKSSIFVGAPGLGKTLSARWIAAQLNLPLYVLDLSSVMSSLLGKTGANLRSALEFAKATDCVLLIDEIDAVAKRRGDDADIGELKRLVTVLLQEVDQWPDTGLLLAATNHPELIDPALWRRFDSVVEFELPNEVIIRLAVERFFASDAQKFEQWFDVLALISRGSSFSDIERLVQQIRRASILKVASMGDLLGGHIQKQAENLSKEEQIKCAALLSAQSSLSQRKISEITRVSRPTIRRYLQLNDVK